MRVIAGRLGGRIFDSPHGHRTHPMSEKARGAIFNALGDIDGLTVLDAYSGSGALAIEAVSRGAASALAIDVDKEAINAIKRNVTALGLSDDVIIRRQNISTWSRGNEAAKFDLVFADPPYDDIKLKDIELIASHVRSGGIFVLSWPGNLDAPSLQGLERVLEKPLGDIHLYFYRLITNR